MEAEGPIGIGLGMLEGAINQGLNQQQFQQQQELMEIAQQNQMALNQQGSDLQYKLWKKTSYPKQVEMMKKAGLNPALMYKGAGAAGSTGSQTGGSAASGNAPQAWRANMQTVLMGLEAKSLEKDIENKEIQNQLDRIEVNRQLGENKRGEAEIEKVIAETRNIDEDTKLKAEQKLKTISEKKLNESMIRLNKLKEDKGVTGSAINDLFNNLGLDPTNNETDKWVVRGMLVAHYGIDNITKIARLFPKGIENVIMKWFKGGN